MNVLSLCDGMSCGRIALEKAGIPVERYFAAEIKPVAIKVSKANYPDIIRVGDVNKIRYDKDTMSLIFEEPETKTEMSIQTQIDLVIFGSPCQTFSIAIPTEHRVGLENLEKSGLFYECNRILKEVNPTWWMMENVASMRKSDAETISAYLGVRPYKIDAKDFGPALRNRLYWTNIPVDPMTLFDRVYVPNFNDILTEGYSDREKARCLCVEDSRPNSTPIKMFHRYYSTGFTTLIFKSVEHYKACKEEYERLFGGKRCADIASVHYDGHVFDGVRYMNKIEMERCQGVPEGYTDCLTRNEAADVLGDGWNIDVITHIFKSIPQF